MVLSPNPLKSYHKPIIPYPFNLSSGYLPITSQLKLHAVLHKTGDNHTDGWQDDICALEQYCKSINFCVPFILRISRSIIKQQNEMDCKIKWHSSRALIVFLKIENISIFKVFMVFRSISRKISRVIFCDIFSRKSKL